MTCQAMGISYESKVLNTAARSVKEIVSPLSAVYDGSLCSGFTMEEINGVDINHNYDAGWKVVKEYPSNSGYAGPYSESEPETKAIVELVRAEEFDMLIAFHSQGGEIYYDFDGSVPDASEALAMKMAQVSGYKATVPEGTAAYGGCKDWFIKEFSKAGFTIEMGRGKNPLPDEMLDKIYDENAKIILSAFEELM